MPTTHQEPPTFSPEVYSRIALNDLVTYAVFHVAQSRREITAEDIVAACFTLFPERFQLRGYAQWPDSTVVNKRWVDCRDKGFLRGSTAAGFSLTPKGLELAEKTASVLAGTRKQFVNPNARKVSSENRTRAGRFVRSLEKSDAFLSYSADGSAENITEFDFRSMLLCTMESSGATLRSNFEEFKQCAALYKRDDLLQFLDHCKARFFRLLTDANEDGETYRGGMIRQKVK